MLSERQEQILRVVVGSYLESGHPVGSMTIAARGDIAWSASTVRAELAALERGGFLTHPHTSAGRTPTESGYRLYANALLDASRPARVVTPTLELDVARREIDEAMRETTVALSRVNDLLALVTAPPRSTARIHRIQVLALQPRVVTVVVIASSGEVTRRVFGFERRVDPGLVEWASSFLNERLGGIALGARRISDRLHDPELGAQEAWFIDAVADAFTGLGAGPEASLYVEGASRLLSEEHAGDLPQANDLIGVLERRRSLLSILSSALDERSVFLWIGDENPEPELRSVSVVGANYGLGYRNLGAVGVIGPMRMDYATAIASVHDAAGELSRFFETVYEG